jgi:hypothetical protein
MEAFFNERNLIGKIVRFDKCSSVSFILRF